MNLWIWSLALVVGASPVSAQGLANVPFGIDAEAVKRLCPIAEVADYRAIIVRGSKAEVCAALWVAVIGERPWTASRAYIEIKKPL